MINLEIKVIGVVHTIHDDNEIRTSISGVDGQIEIFREYEAGLKGIEGFSHLIIIAWLHKVTEEQRRVLRIRPRKWVRLGIDISDVPEVGVFCSDSPHRPNPIALTVVKLVKRIGNILYVDGLDLFDGTLVLDIKPYTPGRIISDIRVPDWYYTLSNRIRKKFGKNVEL